MGEEDAEEEDIKDAQIDFDEAGAELAELTAARDEAMESSSIHISDGLKMVIRSIDQVLREQISMQELKALRSRVARYQKLFHEEVMPFVECCQWMQRAECQSHNEVTALPPANASWDTAISDMNRQFAVLSVHSSHKGQDAAVQDRHTCSILGG